MKQLFALCLTEHHKWGYVLSPYILETEKGKDYLIVQELVTVENIKKYENLLTDVQIKIVNRTAKYSEKEIARVIKRTANVTEFLKTVTVETVERDVRPFVERNLRHCIDMLPNSNTRLFLKDSQMRIYLAQEIFYGNEQAEAVFNFHYKPNEGLKYFLSLYYQGKEVSLFGKRFISLLKKPTVIVFENNLLSFEDIDEKKLQPFVTKKHIEVSATQVDKYFKVFVLESIRKYRTNAQGFDIIDEKPLSVPILSLEADLSYRPVLALRFDYGNGRKPFNASAPFETKVSLDVKGKSYTVRRFNRNQEFEKEKIEFLSELGFYYAGNSFFYENKETSLIINADDINNLLANLIEKLNTLSDLLTEKGFRIEQNFYSEKYFTGNIKLIEKYKTEFDWFDITITVEIGGYEIPFIGFRDNIIRQDRNYMLPNGETAILPAEWMSRYSQLMLMSENQNGNLRLKRQYFTIVDDIFKLTDNNKFHNIKALCNVNDIKPFETPKSIQATLRPYQLQGVTWLRLLNEHRLGGCLCDDMGLGKTLQTIVLLQSQIEKSTNFSAQNSEIETNLTSLIVMPSSLIHNWVNEIKRFAPQLKVLKYVGADRQNNTAFGNYHIVLTTYGTMRNDTEILSRFKFFYAILDESQYIRNPDSLTYKSVLQLQAYNYLTLTGTPVENTLTDLWAQMNFLNRGLLGNINFFKKHFTTPIEKQDDKNALKGLQRLVQPYLLRRTKEEVAPELPELTELVRYCEMTDTQRSIYEEEKSKVRNEILKGFSEKTDTIKMRGLVLRALGRLRQLAIHPKMLDFDYSDDSGKFDQIIEIVESLYSENHKALLFSFFTKHLDIIAEHLKKEHIPYSLLTGKTQNREEVIQQFNKSKEIPFFLISLKAGGVGLNLTSADYVFLLDPWWNPAVENQAISRAHRIGQTKKVFAYRMLTSDTIEEKIHILQQKKTELFQSITGSVNPFSNFSDKDIVELFE